MEIGEMSGAPWIMTSCYHILCNACSYRIVNKVCIICNAQCKIAQIGQDMPPGKMFKDCEFVEKKKLYKKRRNYFPTLNSTKSFF